MNKKITAVVGATAIALTLTFAYQKPSFAQVTVPPEVQKGIDTASATVEALNPISQKALSVALLPLGAFLTLAFVSKVMSRV